MKKSNYLVLLGLAIVLGQSCKKKSDDPAPVTVTPTPVTPTPGKTWNTLNGQQPLVIGHRGYSGLRPDHTLASYQLSIEAGADFVEPDLVMTKDSILICRHEPMLSGTTDVADHAEFSSRKVTKMVDGVSTEDWFANDFTLAEIRTLRAKQPLAPLRSSIFDGIYSVPTFQELIDLVMAQSSLRGRTIGIYPETKHPTFHGDNGSKMRFTDKVLETLQQNRLNSFDAPVYLQSFEVANLKYARSKSTVKIVQLYDANDVLANGTMEMLPPYAQPYDFVVAGKTTTYNDMITDAGLTEVKTYANGIGPWKPFISPYFNNKRLPATDLITRAHQKGLVVHAYTFRKEPKYIISDYNGDFQAELKYFYSLGVDGVFTDFTDDAVAARK